MPFVLVKPETSCRVERRGPPAYRFDYWLGDDLVGSPPVFLVTGRLKDALLALDPEVPFHFEPVRVEPSSFYLARNPGRELPAFWRWRVEGRPGVDDAGLLAGWDLVVSGRVLEALLAFRVEQAQILQFRDRATA
jgi:hypothetical protein